MKLKYKYWELKMLRDNLNLGVADIKYSSLCQEDKEFYTDFYKDIIDLLQEDMRENR